MDNIELQHLHNVHLKMMLEIKRICEKHNIKYFLDAGTMLGAARHKGFIPWDDDVDIGFLRSEYDRFLEVAEQELGEEYYIHSDKTDDNYGMAFAKLRLKGTVFKEIKSNNRESHNEIFVDLFAYDNVSDNQMVRKAEAVLLKILSHLLFIRCGYGVWRGEGVGKAIKFLPLRFAAIFFGKRFLRRNIANLLQRHNGENCELMSSTDTNCRTWWNVPADTLQEYCEVDFEGLQFAIPKKYDAFLTSTYGDYMTPPPEQERSKGHQVVKADFGEY